MKNFLLGCTVAVCLHGQSPIEWASDQDEQQAQDVIRRLVTAVNARDIVTVKSLTTPRLNVRGAGRWFNESGVFRLSERQDENLTGVELATLTREVHTLSPGVLMAEGFFRTVGWPVREYSGDLSVILHRIEGRWRVSLARFNPILDDGTFFEVKQSRSRQAGWIDLNTLDAFCAPSGKPVPQGWSISDGAIHLGPKSPPGGIRTRETFQSFEFEFEWRVPPKGNSGVKYRILYLTRTDASGSEYQVADDAGDRGATAHPNERSASLYKQIAPVKSANNPVGEFNQARIVIRGRRVEHWLNGERVVEYETESSPIESPILLQNHGTEVWYRNLRIRRLE
jgi:hypothetical protein